MLDKQLKLIRSNNRIASTEIISQIITDFTEIHGDRVLGDDPAITTGIGFLADIPVTILAVNRGKTMMERQRFNGGQVRVSGYRKALRVVEAAEKFNRPVISLIDMPGADASVDSENHGQSQAIADLIDKMGALTVPNIALFVGEGHSGGALALSNVNRILMLEAALFSVASPEAVSAIITTNDDVSDYLPMTSNQLKLIGINDETILENDQLIVNIKQALLKHIQELKLIPRDSLPIDRSDKFNRILATWNTGE